MNPPNPSRHDGDDGSATVTLLRRYHERGDITARERLIELYLPLVDSLTRRYARSSDDRDDLYQVGCIGLINAIDRFDLERGEELAAFAVPNIAGEIKRYLRDRSGSVRLPRRTLELRASLLRAQRQLAPALGRAPTTAELAEAVGADEREVARALAAHSAALPLDPALEADADASLDEAEDRLFLSGAARGLDERERRILYLRYVRDLEPDVVARELGISRRQLSRNTQAALAKVRTGLEGGAPGLPTPAPEPKMASVASRPPLREERNLDQPYHIELVKDAEPGGGWTAQVEELSGCRAHGATPDEAARGIEAAMRDWIADALAHGREVPKPRSAASHSGRLLVRMPQSLHAELARAAEREEVSLNQFITSSLASAVGWRRGDEPAGASASVSVSAAASAAEDPESAGGRSSGVRMAIVANIAVLALVAAVAVVLLIIALSRGL